MHLAYSHSTVSKQQSPATVAVHSLLVTTMAYETQWFTHISSKVSIDWWSGVNWCIATEPQVTTS